MFKVNNPDQFRVNVRDKIALLMNMDMDMDIKTEDENNYKKCLTIASNIEIGIYNYSIRTAIEKNIIKKWENKIFVQLYVDRLRSIYNNLKNRNFLQKIMDKEIDVDKIAVMTHREMNPEKWCKLLIQKEKIDASKVTDTMEASTDVYLCRRCKSRKCTYEAVQIRSSDEPMTIFVNCLNCGKNWTC